MARLHKPLIWAFVGAVLGLSSAFWYASSRKAQQSGLDSLPRIDFSKSHFDFGDVGAGVDLTQTFTFTNRTGTDIAVSRVETSCGCLASDWQGEIIPNGAEGRVSLTLSTKKSAEPGIVGQSATVRFGSRDLPPKKLTLVARVVPYIACLPDKVVIDPEQTMQELQIERRLIGTHHFSKLSVSFPPGLEVRNVVKSEVAHSYSFGRNSPSVHLHYEPIVIRYPSGEGGDSETRILVSVCDSKDAIEITPTSITLLASSIKMPPAQRTVVNIHSKSRQRIQIKSVRLSELDANEIVGSAIDEQTPESGATFTVWLKAAPKQSVWRSELEIELSEMETDTQLKRTLPVYVLSAKNE